MCWSITKETSSSDKKITFSAVSLPISKQEVLRCKNGILFLYVEILLFICFWWESVWSPSVCGEFVTFSTSSQPLPAQLPNLYHFEVINPRWLSWPDWSRHFQLLLQNYYMWRRQSQQKCSFSGHPVVLLFFRAIWNSTWMSQYLIGWDILNFFPKSTSFEVTRLVDVPLVVFKKSCY